METCLDLAGLQERLLQQYSRLRDLRADENYSVYAIEHGLSAGERVAARTLLNAQLESSMRANRAYWLVWIAAAAEVGYRYDGSEYWDSFSAAFPKWRLYGDRNQIRHWYQRFAAEFRGLTPSGLWASQFPIIAWPITQAILPRYLQRHFADHLYQLRHALARSSELTLEEIGDLLSERYFGGSSRFDGFLQQKVLTARIVMALGLEDIADNVAPIEAAILNRIVRDFDKLGTSGARLREARNALRDARFINSSRQGFVSTTRGQASTDHERSKYVHGLKLAAHRVDEQTWNVRLAIPDLATPLRQTGLSPQELGRSRMRFRQRGEGNAWIPARALFAYAGNSTEPLISYPTSEKQIFEFDCVLTRAESALQERLTLSAQPLRLLRIRTDGSAFEVAGLHVRANQSYLLISANGIADDVVQSLQLCRLQTNLAGAHLWQLNVQQTLETAHIAALKSLGLGYVLGVHIEPLGLSPRWSMTSGAIEFLDSETALFSLSSDITVREFLIAVDANPPMRFKPVAAGHTHISLGTLAVGPHRIRASALGAATGADIEAEDIDIEVRPSIPWQRAIAGKAGVSLVLDPRQATLEQLFDSNALIRIAAPPHRNVKLYVHFYGADGALTYEEMLGSYTTPILDRKLSQDVVRRLTSDAQIENVERAVRIELTISLDELGAESITFEKDAEPLRWLRLDGSTIRLSDDSAGGTPPTVHCFNLSAAEKAREIDYEKAIEGIELVGKGGLLVANQNGRRYGVIATVMQSQITSFSALGIPASLSSVSIRPARIINALKQWQSARRLMGPMAFMARRNAIFTLEQHLELLMCGEDWVAASGSVRAGTQAIGKLYGRVFYSRGFAAGLRAFDWQYETEEVAALSEFIRLTSLYKVNGEESLCRLALKLAFSPSKITPSDLPSKDAFEALKANATLMRGAYFARLATDMRAQNSVSEAA